MSRPQHRLRMNFRRHALPACAAALLVCGPAGAQERSGTAPDTIAVALSDSARADSLQHPAPRRPRGLDLPQVVRRPPPDTRAPWPFGPKNRYAHTGALVGAAVGAADGLATDRSTVVGAFLLGALGYMVGMLFD